MAIVFLQSAIATGTSSAVATFPAAATPGSLLALTVVDDSGLATGTNVTVADNQANGGNAYTLLQYSHPNSSLSTFYARSIAAAGTFAITVTNSLVNGNVVSVVAQEFGGLDLAAPLDKLGVGTSASTNAPTATTATATAVADELVIGSLMATGATGLSVGAGSGLSVPVTAQSTAAIAAQAYKIVTATGAQTASFALGAARTSLVQVATFKAGAAYTGRPRPQVPMLRM